MAEKPISRFPVPELSGLPDDRRGRMLEVQEKAGFIPNILLALAHCPQEFLAFFAYHDAFEGFYLLRGIPRGISPRARQEPVMREISQWHNKSSERWSF